MVGYRFVHFWGLPTSFVASCRRLLQARGMPLSTSFNAIATMGAMAAMFNVDLFEAWHQRPRQSQTSLSRCGLPEALEASKSMKWMKWETDRFCLKDSERGIVTLNLGPGGSSEMARLVWWRGTVKFGEHCSRVIVPPHTSGNIWQLTYNTNTL